MKKLRFLFLPILLLTACSQVSTPEEEPQASIDAEVDKKAILDALYNETKSAFARDYEAWQSYWVHRSSISKTYINFADSSSTEMIGWAEVDNFVKTYFAEHPDPVPPPAQSENIDVKVYGSGAWVSYEIMDAVYGRKRETRLMEKEDGNWKIAGMHTTIYGFEDTTE